MRFIVCILFTLVAVNAALNQTRRNSDEEESKSVEVTKTEKKKKDRSTSSESGQAQSGETEGDSLEMTASEGSSTSDSAKKRTKPAYVPQSSDERRGWRKWHRKCKPCPNDMMKKWRDPSIRWVCGTYQRARRTFKSKCMMEYRNCQDGTMFVSVHGGRCKNQTARGDHFFYEYRVQMSYESADSKASTTETDVSEESSY